MSLTSRPGRRCRRRSAPVRARSACRGCRGRLRGGGGCGRAAPSASPSAAHRRRSAAPTRQTPHGGSPPRRRAGRCTPLRCLPNTQRLSDTRSTHTHANQLHQHAKLLTADLLHDGVLGAAPRSDVCPTHSVCQTLAAHTHTLISCTNTPNSSRRISSTTACWALHPAPTSAQHTASVRHSQHTHTR